MDTTFYSYKRLVYILLSIAHVVGQIYRIYNVSFAYVFKSFKQLYK